MKYLIVTSGTVFSCIVLLCLCLLFSRTASVSVMGFAVDQNDRLYVGKEKEICIYDNGQLIGRISPYSSRTYAFTITEEDTILLSTASKAHTMDLNGNILSTTDDLSADIYNQLSYNKREFVSVNGDIYTLSSMFGWTRILKNETEVVYQIDTLSYIVKILLGFSFISLFLLGIYVACMQNRKSSY